MASQFPESQKQPQSTAKGGERSLVRGMAGLHISADVPAALGPLLLGLRRPLYEGL